MHSLFTMFLVLHYANATPVPREMYGYDSMAACERMIPVVHDEYLQKNPLDLVSVDDMQCKPTSLNPDRVVGFSMPGGFSLSIKVPATATHLDAIVSTSATMFVTLSFSHTAPVHKELFFGTIEACKNSIGSTIDYYIRTGEQDFNRVEDVYCRPDTPSTKK